MIVKAGPRGAKPKDDDEDRNAAWNRLVCAELVALRKSHTQLRSMLLIVLGMVVMVRSNQELEGSSFALALGVLGAGLLIVGTFISWWKAKP